MERQLNNKGSYPQNARRHGSTKLRGKVRTVLPTTAQKPSTVKKKKKSINKEGGGGQKAIFTNNSNARKKKTPMRPKTQQTKRPAQLGRENNKKGIVNYQTLRQSWTLHFSPIWWQQRLASRLSLEGKNARTSVTHATDIPTVCCGPSLRLPIS